MNSGALAEFRRAGEPERRKLPGTAWICPIGSLSARLFHGPGYCSHERANHNSNNNPSHLSASSHLAQRVFVRFSSRRAGGLFYSRYLLAVFSISVIILFLLSYLLVCGARRWNALLKLHESRITSCTFATTCKMLATRSFAILSIQLTIVYFLTNLQQRKIFYLAYFIVNFFYLKFLYSVPL